MVFLQKAKIRQKAKEWPLWLWAPRRLWEISQWLTSGTRNVSAAEERSLNDL